MSKPVCFILFAGQPPIGFAPPAQQGYGYPPSQQQGYGPPAPQQQVYGSFAISGMQLIIINKEIITLLLLNIFSLVLFSKLNIIIMHMAAVNFKLINLFKLP